MRISILFVYGRYQTIVVKIARYPVSTYLIATATANERLEYGL